MRQSIGVGEDPSHPNVPANRPSCLAGRPAAAGKPSGPGRQEAADQKNRTASHHDPARGRGGRESHEPHVRSGRRAVPRARLTDGACRRADGVDSGRVHRDRRHGDIRRHPSWVATLLQRNHVAAGVTGWQGAQQRLRHIPANSHKTARLATAWHELVRNHSPHVGGSSPPAATTACQRSSFRDPLRPCHRLRHCAAHVLRTLLESQSSAVRRRRCVWATTGATAARAIERPESARRGRCAGSDLQRAPPESLVALAVRRSASSLAVMNQRPPIVHVGHYGSRAAVERCSRLRQRRKAHGGVVLLGSS